MSHDRDHLVSAGGTYEISDLACVIQHVRSPANAAKIFPPLFVCNFIVTSGLYYEWLCISVVLLCVEGIVRRRLFSGFLLDVYFSVTYLPALISVRQKRLPELLVYYRPCNQTNPYCSPNFYSGISSAIYLTRQ